MARFGINCLLCDRVIILEGLEEQRAFAGLMVSPKICEKCRELWREIKEKSEEKRDEIIS